ncbi:MAG: cytochrome c biogenesis protein CcdA [Spirochaetaceae bacterium]|jgi:cytochrome c-type biogenesis protein|nr:cytochrome c biogenesis protein CcdA [Spirochaetaceae bacterium]
MIEPSVPLVFAAGLLSFLSPCVLPLIPSYLSILGSARKGADGKPALFVSALSFVLGFSAVFIVLSMLISGTFLLMGGVSKYLRIAAGIIVIILGLNVIFNFLKVLNYEKRIRQSGRPGGMAGNFIAGVCFGTGWTPCIGPVLTSVLLLAGQSGKTTVAILYLGVYSAGLGLPFLAAALFFDRFLVSAGWFRSHLGLIQKISGILLICFGLMILTGGFSVLNILIQKWQYQFITWAGDKSPVFRFLAGWLSWVSGI